VFGEFVNEPELVDLGDRQVEFGEFVDFLKVFFDSGDDQLVLLLLLVVLVF